MLSPTDNLPVHDTTQCVSFTKTMDELDSKLAKKMENKTFNKVSKMDTNKIEIERKYRLTSTQYHTLIRDVTSSGCELSIDNEENILYAGNGLDPSKQVLRVRDRGDLIKAVLTYKQKLSNEEGIRKAIEEETMVDYAEPLKKILSFLGYKPSLVYEKKRLEFPHNGAWIAVDQLPFGYFLEIECVSSNTDSGTEKPIECVSTDPHCVNSKAIECNEENISQIEKFIMDLLDIDQMVPIEQRSYPELTRFYGTQKGDIIESRF